MMLSQGISSFIFVFHHQANPSNLSLQNTLAYLCNSFFIKYICFSLTSGSNPLSHKEKSLFNRLTTMFLSNIVGASGKKWEKVGVGNVSGSSTTQSG
jgi:hypothetical protein